MAKTSASPPRTQSRRFIKPTPWNLAGGSKTVASAGRIYFQLVEIDAPCAVAAVTWQTAGTQAGNARVGIFGPLATANTPSGDSLVAESASTATANANQLNSVAFSTTPRLVPGQYMLALAFDNTSNTFIGNASAAVVFSNATAQADQAYGAMPSTIPALSQNTTNQPAMILTVTP